MDEQADLVRKAKEKAYAYLDYSARTKREMTDYLKKAKFSAQVIAAVMADLERYNLINDTGYVQNWIELRLKNKPLGRRAAEYELKKRGIGEDVYHPVLDEAYETVSEEDLVRRIVEKRRSRYDLSDPKGKKRLASFLQRRGFKAHSIYTALNMDWE